MKIYKSATMDNIKLITYYIYSNKRPGALPFMCPLKMIFLRQNRGKNTNILVS